MIAANIESLQHGQRADLARDANLHVVTRQQAADLLNVSTRSVADAHKIRTNAAPEVIQAVEQGQMPVSLAELCMIAGDTP